MTDDAPDPTRGPQPGVPIAERVLGLLNRLAVWIGANRRRQTAATVVGCLLVATLVFGLRFGRDVPTFVRDVGALARDIGSAAREGLARPEPAPPPSPAPPPPADPLRSLPRDLVAEIVRPDIAAPIPFGRSFRVAPNELCRKFAELGFSGARIIGNPVAPAEWACDSDLVPLVPPSGDGSQPATVFFSMRGDRPDRITRVRLKLNLTDELTAAVARQRFLDLLHAIHAEFHWDVPPEVETAVTNLSTAYVDRFGLVYDIRREFSELPRLNVVISFSTDAGILGTDRFEGPLNPRDRQLMVPPRPGPAKLPVRSEPAIGIDGLPVDGGAPGGAIEDITR